MFEVVFVFLVALLFVSFFTLILYSKQNIFTACAAFMILLCLGVMTTMIFHKGKAFLCGAESVRAPRNPR